MSNPIPTAIGRVQPIFKGDYDDSKTYNKLDNVYYQGNTWVCLKNGVASAPVEGEDWQLVASKGDTGGIGTPTASAVALETGNAYATVSIDPDSPASSKIFQFEFGLPRGLTGPAGITTATATATALVAGSAPTANVVLNTETYAASFEFGIPMADGTGIKKVDNIGADSSGNANLGAVRYNDFQNLDPTYQNQARINIGAMAAPASSAVSVNQYLYYNNNNEWIGKAVREVPAIASADNGKYLRVNNNQAYWADVIALPTNGGEGSILMKRTSEDYDVMWEAAISTSQIEELFE